MPAFAVILLYVAVAVLFVVNHARVPVAPAANVPAVRADSPSIIFVLLFIVCFFSFRGCPDMAKHPLVRAHRRLRQRGGGDIFLINATEKETYINKIRE